jgi:hypothetical protein
VGGSSRTGMAYVAPNKGPQTWSERRAAARSAFESEKKSAMGKLDKDVAEKVEKTKGGVANVFGMALNKMMFPGLGGNFAAAIPSFEDVLKQHEATTKQQLGAETLNKFAERESAMLAQEKQQDDFLSWYMKNYNAGKTAGSWETRGRLGQVYVANPNFLTQDQAQKKLDETINKYGIDSAMTMLGYNPKNQMAAPSTTPTKAPLAMIKAR